MKKNYSQTLYLYSMYSVIQDSPTNQFKINSVKGENKQRKEKYYIEGLLFSMGHTPECKLFRIIKAYQRPKHLYAL